jgi:hypothetical protein
MEPADEHSGYYYDSDGDLIDLYGETMNNTDDYEQFMIDWYIEFEKELQQMQIQVAIENFEWDEYCFWSFYEI